MKFSRSLYRMGEKLTPAHPPVCAELQNPPAIVIRPPQKRVASQGTQTSWVEPPAPAPPVMVDASCTAMVSERLVAERYCRRMGLFLGSLHVQEHVWWMHFSACMRMPRGGFNSTGSQACTFEYAVPGERVLQGRTGIATTRTHRFRSVGRPCHPPGLQPRGSIRSR